MFSLLASIMLIFTIIIGVLTTIAIMNNDNRLCLSGLEAIFYIVVAGLWFLFVMFLLWCIAFSDALITNHPVEILPATIITSTVYRPS